MSRVRDTSPAPLPFTVGAKLSLFGVAWPKAVVRLPQRSAYEMLAPGIALSSSLDQSSVMAPRRAIRCAQRERADAMTRDGRLSKRRSLGSTVAARRAAGALLVSIAIAGCAATAPSSSPTGSRDTTATPTAAATATISPTISPLPTVPGQIGRWVPISAPVPVASADEQPDAIFGWSRGYVLFHETVIDTADENADQIAITPWVSDDGRSWQRGQPLDVAGLDTVEIGEMVEGPAGLEVVARGPAYGELDDVDLDDAVVGMWTSRDGNAWNRVDLAGAFGTPVLGDIAAGPHGYIASNPSSQAASIAPAVWLSSDGRKWKPVALRSGNLAGAHLGSAYVLPNGYLLAGWDGAPVGEDLETTPAVWFSPDGLTWRETPLPGVVAVSTMEAAVETRGPGHYIALATTWSCGCEPPHDDQAWSSIDGVSWQPAPAASFGDDVIWDGRQAVRLVFFDGAPTVETSLDGLAWSAVAVSGLGPSGYGSAVNGPTGVMVQAGDGQLWLLALG